MARKSKAAFGSLVVTVGVLLLAAAAVQAQPLCGDADGNGQITDTDGVNVLRAAALLTSSCTLAVCDVDGNGQITDTDGVNVLRAAAGLASVQNCTGSVPATATPASTPAPTPTAACPAGPVFQGSLTQTTGRFNYDLTLGLPGANAACNSNFAGSHLCSYFELQCAETAGSLVGATDTSALTVTSFWAIDSSAPPGTQCVDDVGSNLNWEYGTAHTASRGQRVALDNALGTLGPLQTGLQCNFSGNSWVGCCQ